MLERKPKLKITELNLIFFCLLKTEERVSHLPFKLLTLKQKLKYNSKGIFFDFLSGQSSPLKPYFYQNGVSLPLVCGERVHTGRPHTRIKHILRLLWKMDENMFFLDSKHAGMGGMLSPQNISIEFGRNSL